jgi:hypothetical protein
MSVKKIVLGVEVAHQPNLFLYEVKKINPQT